jgi:hypothetical protein
MYFVFIYENRMMKLVRTVLRMDKGYERTMEDESKV